MPPPPTPGKTELANSVNQLRLGTEQDYYNSGVLLMDLEAGRREIVPQEIFRYVEQHRKELILPDQDILNALYSEKILPLEDALWNYDARNYSNYLLRSGGRCDLRWVMEHTAILHFCGKEKPWKPKYIHTSRNPVPALRPAYPPGLGDHSVSRRYKK